MPATQPPMAEAISVLVWISPACPVVMPHMAIRVGTTKLSICVSMPSRP
jgi:ammonia channel protein AmtB